MSESTYVFGKPWHGERARLTAAEELLDPGTVALLERLSVAPGARCLEVGAGGGSIAAWLSDRVGPLGHVVATDINTEFLERLGRRNLEVRRHDVVNDALEEGAFDLVHARLVLEHLPGRDAALAKLVRALAPGGTILVEALDYVCGIPITEYGGAEHERTQSVRLREFSKVGLDPFFGRRLPALLRSNGVVEVGNEGRTWVMEGGSAGARWFKLSMEHARARLVGSAKLDDAEIDRMLALFDDPAWAAMSPLVVAAWGCAGSAAAA
jgi:SAM-dependent methyltransferase